MISRARAIEIGCSLMVVIMLALVSSWLEVNVIQLAITLVIIYDLLIRKNSKTVKS